MTSHRHTTAATLLQLLPLMLLTMLLTMLPRQQLRRQRWQRRQRPRLLLLSAVATHAATIATATIATASCRRRCLRRRCCCWRWAALVLVGVLLLPSLLLLRCIEEQHVDDASEKSQNLHSLRTVPEPAFMRAKQKTLVGVGNAGQAKWWRGVGRLDSRPRATSRKAQLLCRQATAHRWRCQQSAALSTTKTCGREGKPTG